MQTKTVEITTKDGNTYRATRNSYSVTISYKDHGQWIWAGDGKWDNGITDCPADLGDEAYDLLDAALNS